jgi:hypothetical protein
VRGARLPGASGRCQLSGLAHLKPGKGESTVEIGAQWLEALRFASKPRGLNRLTDEFQNVPAVLPPVLVCRESVVEAVPLRRSRVGVGNLTDGK